MLHDDTGIIICAVRINPACQMAWRVLCIYGCKPSMNEFGDLFCPTDTFITQRKFGGCWRLQTDWILITLSQLCIVNSIIFSLHNVITVTEVQVMWFEMYRSVC